ncbi:hypothetical protein AALC16_08555 [Lachnospiraceae bacterium 29-91]
MKFYVYLRQMRFEDKISCVFQVPDADYDLTAENSLDLFHFENHLHDWLFEDAGGVLHKIFNKFKSNFVNSAYAKNICAQIYYICCRVLIKRENAAPPGEYLSRITQASDIFFRQQFHTKPKAEWVPSETKQS